MPTWRKHISNENEFINSQYFKMINGFLNNEKLLSLIKDKGYKIIFKPHFELLKYCDLLNIPDEILLSEDESYQELFNKSMLLITDYSSVYIDYLLIDKPICFAMDDLEEYRKNRGFAYEPVENYLPGEIVDNCSALMNWINNINLDSFKEDRAQLKKLFYVNPDQYSSKRVLCEMGIT